MKIFFLLSFLCILASPTLGYCEIRQCIPHKYHGPVCLIGLCIGENLVHENEIIRTLGEGYIYDGVDKYICYQLANDIYFNIQINTAQDNLVTSIFLSDVPSCNNSKKIKKLLRDSSTKEGLEIGDSIGKVMSIYGTPDSIDRGTGLNMVGIDYEKAINSTPFGDRVLNYFSPDGDLFHSEIYIRGEKVSAILISISP